MAQSAAYTGLYINLDRSTDRRRAVEDQLAKFDLSDRYARFAAIDAKDVAPSSALRPGEVACFHSHYQALMKGGDRGLPVHILEDDVLLSKYLDEAARKIVDSNFFDQFDIVFTDTFVHTNVMQLASYKRAFDHALAGGKDAMKFIVIDLATRQMACMASYFVAAKSIEKVLKVFGDELARGPTMPVDFCLRLAAQEGRLRVGCWFPFVTSIMLDCITASTMERARTSMTIPPSCSPRCFAIRFSSIMTLKDMPGRFLKR